LFKEYTNVLDKVMVINANNNTRETYIEHVTFNGRKTIGLPSAKVVSDGRVGVHIGESYYNAKLT
jgi:hypothetical protein